MDPLKSIAPYTKTLVALVVSCLQVLSVYVVLNGDGSLSPADQQALINSIILGLGGTGAVYQLPNREAK